MYAIHSTTGFIVDSRAYGEAGKLISIFTRDLGMITAVAQGIRLEKSKLRYSTQDHSFGTFSLVRGKELWRLTSAAGCAGIPTDRSLSERRPSPTVGASSAGPEEASAQPAAHRFLIAQIAILLKRLLQGEEAHPELFTCVENCLSFLRYRQDLDAEQLKTVESIVVLQILHALGYVGGRDLGAFIAPRSLETLGLLDQATKERAAINRHINKALKESHL